MESANEYSAMSIVKSGKQSGNGANEDTPRRDTNGLRTNTSKPGKVENGHSPLRSKTGKGDRKL